MNFSSLNAGTTTEIFMMRSLTDDRPKVKDQSKGKTSRRIHVLVNTRADSGRDRMLRSLNRCNPRPAFARGATGDNDRERDDCWSFNPRPAFARGATSS